MISVTNTGLLTPSLTEKTELFWGIKVDPASTSTNYFWAGKNTTMDGDTFVNRLVKGFKGPKVTKGKLEQGLLSEISVTFKIEDVAGTYSGVTFQKGDAVEVYQGLTRGTTEEKIWTWKLKVDTVKKEGSCYIFTCSDSIATNKNEIWPKTNLMTSLFNCKEEGKIIPEIFGTAFIPLPAFSYLDASDSINKAGYILGEISGSETYTITKVLSPPEFSTPVEIDLDNIVQKTYTVGSRSFRVLEINNSDETELGIGWSKNGNLQPPVVQFSKTSTSSFSPIDLLARVFDDFDIDYNSTSFSSVESTLAGYSDPVVFNGGWWFQSTLDTVVRQILLATGTTLVRDRNGDLSLQILDFSNQKTFALSEIIEKSFKITDLKNNYSDIDSGQIHFSPLENNGQCFPWKILVSKTVGGSTTNVLQTGKELKFHFATGSTTNISIRNAKRSMTQYLQMLGNSVFQVSFSTDFAGVRLQPNDMITLPSEFGGFAVLIDTVHYGSDGYGKIDITATYYSQLQEWADITGLTTETFASHVVDSLLRGVFMGPDGTGQNVIDGRLRIGEDTEQCIVFDSNDANGWMIFGPNTNPLTSTFRFNKSGNFVLGDTDEEYLSYDTSTGKLTTNMEIEVTSVPWDAISDAPTIHTFFYQLTAPADGMVLGDYWQDSATRYWYRYDPDYEDNNGWEPVQDQDIIDALETAYTAKATADGKIKTFRSDEPPASGYSEGDLWFDLDDSLKQYRYNETTDIWESVRDSDIAQALEDASDALDIANAAADGLVIIFYDDEFPTSEAATGDLLIKTDEGNALYRFNGTDWDSVDNDDLQTALTSAQDAQDTADGKITAFYQDDFPSDSVSSSGDLWFDTNNENKPYRYDATRSTSPTGNRWVATAYDVAAWSKITDDNGHKPDNDADNTEARFVTSVSTTSGGITLKNSSNYPVIVLGMHSTDRGVFLYDGSAAASNTTLLARYSQHGVSVMESGTEVMRLGRYYSSGYSRGLFLFDSGSLVASYADTGLQIFRGGDIYLESVSGTGDSYRGLIIFGASSGQFKIGAKYSSASLCIYPNADGYGNFYIGYDPDGSDKRFNYMYVRTKYALHLDVLYSSGVGNSMQMTYDPSSGGYALARNVFAAYLTSTTRTGFIMSHYAYYGTTNIQRQQTQFLGSCLCPEVNYDTHPPGMSTYGAYLGHPNYRWNYGYFNVVDVVGRIQPSQNATQNIGFSGSGYFNQAFINEVLGNYLSPQISITLGNYIGSNGYNLITGGTTCSTSYNAWVFYGKDISDNTYTLGSLSGTGYMAILGTLSEGSSRKYKENIKSIEGSSLGRILKLLPRKYDRKGTGIKNEYGFIVDEFETVFPSLVSKLSAKKLRKATEDEKRVAEKYELTIAEFIPDEIEVEVNEGIKYSGVIPHLTKTIEELVMMFNCSVERIEFLEKKLGGGLYES